MLHLKISLQRSDEMSLLLVGLLIPFFSENIRLQCKHWFRAGDIEYGELCSQLKSLLLLLLLLFRLPRFTGDEVNVLKGSTDFIGLNHYSSWYLSQGVSDGVGWFKDQQTISR